MSLTRLELIDLSERLARYDAFDTPSIVNSTMREASDAIDELLAEREAQRAEVAAPQPMSLWEAFSLPDTPENRERAVRLRAELDKWLGRLDGPHV